MDDLISRQAAIELIESEYHRYSEEYGITDVLCDLNDLPTAEKKGKWLAGDKMVDYPRIPYEPWSIYCSCCREKAYNGDILFDYCPFCGAKMEE